jgi:hypothetical protein
MASIKFPVVISKPPWTGNSQNPTSANEIHWFTPINVNQFAPLNTAHQAQEQHHRYGGDFTINTYPVVMGEYEREAPSSGVVSAASMQMPISLAIKGPPTLRRIKDAKGNRPYIVSNGGDPLNAGEGTS